MPGGRAALRELVQHLRREADDLEALAAEYSSPETIERRVYEAVELAVRIMTSAIDEIAAELGEAA